ncbi:MAG: serine protein kinase RIO [Thermoplasmata archaeon]
MRQKILDFLESRIDALKHKDKDKDEMRKTASEIFNESTLNTLYRMLSGGVFDTLEFPISTGKEANVFRGTKGEGFVAVKIFRVATATFHSLSKYIVGDPRFKGIARDRRALISTWARKEFKNLERMRKAGVRVPEPIGCKDNVLVMEYIGSEERAAPMLRELEPEPEELKKIRDDVVDFLRLAYTRARLVHGDLSEYNILIHNGETVVIDLGQAVVLEHPMAQELLTRDLKNIALYFTRRGLPLDWKALRSELTEGPWEREGGSGRSGNVRHMPPKAPTPTRAGLAPSAAPEHDGATGVAGGEEE